MPALVSSYMHMHTHTLTHTHTGGGWGGAYVLFHTSGRNGGGEGRGERDSLCVFEREGVCEKEGERDCVCVRVREREID